MENLSVVPGKDLRFSCLLDFLCTAPFLAEKRLILLEGMPPLEKEQVQELEKVMHPSTILAIFDSSPDRRRAAVKALLQCAKVQSFDLLKGMELRSWVLRLFQKEGRTIEQDALVELLQLCGEDQWTLEQEIMKLVSYATGRVTANDVRLLVEPRGEMLVWRLTDLLGAAKEREALRYAKKLTERGHDAHSLWNILLWMLRNLISVSAACEQEANLHVALVAKKAGVPFHSTKALLPLAKRMSSSALTSLVHKAVRDDMALKTGKFRTSARDTTELLAAIDRFILSFSL